jgi:hypothetical protein
MKTKFFGYLNKMERDVVHSTCAVLMLPEVSFNTEEVSSALHSMDKIAKAAEYFRLELSGKHVADLVDELSRVKLMIPEAVVVDKFSPASRSKFYEDSNWYGSWCMTLPVVMKMVDEQRQTLRRLR